MVAVHFTAIAYKLLTVQNVQVKPYICNICPCSSDIVCIRFENSRLFRHVSVSVGIVFVCQELWLPYVPVAIFFPTEDYGSIILHA